ncbi:MAG: phytanoyl-CoA dioxygenase family protein [Caldilineaceae bacterium]|nr:phytanoyl-CoA dioxygenase family protein [Caldilineaceae bacterium]
MDIEQLKTELDECGFVIIQSLFSSADADRKARRLMDLMSRQPNADLQVQGLRGVLNYDDQDIFLPLITNSAYLELAGHLLGPDFQLAEAGAIWIKPDAPAGGFHADVPVGWFPKYGLPVPDACFMINSIWMLTDFSLENGATQLIPFSRHSRRAPDPYVDYKHCVTAEGPVGSTVILHGSIWHRGGANLTQDRRRVNMSVP